MIRFQAFFVVSVAAFAFLVGCTEQELDAPLDTPVSDQLEADPAPVPPPIESSAIADPEIVEDVGGEAQDVEPPKTKLGSIFNALKVGTAEAMDEASEK